jgi:preprotein translocase subunit YajC
MKKYLSCFFTLAAMASSAVLFAQAAPADAPPPGNDQALWQTFTLVGTALVFFYFILYRPEQKRRKAMEEQRSAMKVGDKVNAMGIIGYISKIQDNTLILRMYDGSKIEVLKAAISEIIPVSEEDAKKVKAEEE